MRAFVILAAVLVTLILLVGAGALFFASHRIESIRAEHETRTTEGFARHHDAFVEDQQLAERLSIFPEASGTEDAGPFLNPRLPWSGSTEPIETWEASLPDGMPSLALDPDLVEALTVTEWWLTDPHHWRDVDPGWMADLARYAFWDVEATGPASLISDDAYDWSNLPLPEYRPVMIWAKVRLLHGLADDDVAAAAAEVRHLARLSYSTENLIGAMIALQIMRFEREAYERVRAEDGPLPEGWSPPTEEEIQRLRRATWAAIAYRSIDTPPEHRGQALILGDCTALTESGWAALVYRPFLVDAHRDAFTWLGEAIESSDCRLPRLRRAFAMPEDHMVAPLRAEVCPPADPTCDLQRYKWVPGVRTLIGETLRSIASLSYFRHYED